MSLATEFKEFAMRGNVVDLAVGVVIGAAFGKIVSALVEAIVMQRDRDQQVGQGASNGGDCRQHGPQYARRGEVAVELQVAQRSIDGRCVFQRDQRRKRLNTGPISTH